MSLRCRLGWHDWRALRWVWPYRYETCWRCRQRRAVSLADPPIDSLLNRHWLETGTWQTAEDRRLIPATKLAPDDVAALRQRWDNQYEDAPTVNSRLIQTTDTGLLPARRKRKEGE